MDPPQLPVAIFFPPAYRSRGAVASLDVDFVCSRLPRCGKGKVLWHSTSPPSNPPSRVLSLSRSKAKRSDIGYTYLNKLAPLPTMLPASEVRPLRRDSSSFVVFVEYCVLNNFSSCLPPRTVHLHTPFSLGNIEPQFLPLRSRLMLPSEDFFERRLLISKC